MKTEAIPRRHAVTGAAQHAHQCSWCGRMYGEFTEHECQTGHVYDRCCRECEQKQPARLESMDNEIAKANKAALDTKPSAG